MSAERLASEVGVTKQAVGKWRKDGTIARDKIAPICLALSASADELLGLKPIDAVAEAPALYRVTIRDDALREAVISARHAEDAAGVRLSAVTLAQLIAVAYQVMLDGGKQGQTDPDIFGLVLRALRDDIDPAHKEER